MFLKQAVENQKLQRRLKDLSYQYFNNQQIQQKSLKQTKSSQIGHAKRIHLVDETPSSATHQNNVERVQNIYENISARDPNIRSLLNSITDS